MCRRGSAVSSSVYTVEFAGSLGVTTHQFLLKLVVRSSCCRDFDHGVLCGRLRPSCPSLPLDRGVVVTVRARAWLCIRECERVCVRECTYVLSSVCVCASLCDVGRVRVCVRVRVCYARVRACTCASACANTRIHARVIRVCMNTHDSRPPHSCPVGKGVHVPHRRP